MYRRIRDSKRLSYPSRLLIFFIYFDDSCQNSYLKMYQTDLRQIFKIGRTMAVDDQSEISFSIPTMTLP